MKFKYWLFLLSAGVVAAYVLSPPGVLERMFGSGRVELVLGVSGLAAFGSLIWIVSDFVVDGIFDCIEAASPKGGDKSPAAKGDDPGGK